MGALRDLTGLKFGRLTVIERSLTHPRAKKHAVWRCQCECGGERYVDGYSLNKGRTYDCGSKECIDKRDHAFSEKNMVGRGFGRLTVVSKADGKVNEQILWNCKCGCGKDVVVQGGNLRNGNTKSCGCIRFDTRKTHGLSYTPEYSTWTNMIDRCHNPKNKAYCYYGGRGIEVCEEWRHDFKVFYDYVGKKPGPEYSIERIDPDVSYKPGNVKWATPLEQWENRRIRGLSFRVYQYESRKTARYSKEDKLWDICYCLLGLGSEVGELQGKWKKCIRDNGYELTAKIKRAIIDEAGDALWYLSQLCSELDVSIETVAQLNLNKLRGRQERGVIGGSGDNR